jgi:hypothetical protein
MDGSEDVSGMLPAKQEREQFCSLFVWAEFQLDIIGVLTISMRDVKER